MTTQNDMPCPCCGRSLLDRDKPARRKPKAAGTTNPFGHAFPHHTCVNVSLTPRLIGAQSWSPKMIENDDPRNGGRKAEEMAA
jgi:hypothetical protein